MGISSKISAHLSRIPEEGNISTDNFTGQIPVKSFFNFLRYTITLAQGTEWAASSSFVSGSDARQLRVRDNATPARVCVVLGIGSIVPLVA